MLTAPDLHDAFMELGARARREGKVIDLAIYRGSALMLASNFRVATQDVDAVVEGDQSTFTRWAQEIARARNWLNDGVGLHTPEDVVDFAVRFYPEARISGRRRLGIQALWRVKDTPTQEGRHAAPTYLGRSCPAP